MGQSLLLSLQITALGMGIVFAAIILLSWMMSLLTRFVKDKPEESDAALAESNSAASDSAEAASVTPIPSPTGRGARGEGQKAQAAAVAVALALAEKVQAQPITEPPTALVSAWQLGMRTRQLYQKGSTTPVRRTK